MTEDARPVVSSVEPAVRVKPRRSRKWIWTAGGVAAAVLIYNLTVWIPVSTAVGNDARNEGVGLHAYRTWLVHPSGITIDLVSVGNVAPVDVIRGLFQAAAALKDREFGRVSLARQGKVIFIMEGADFAELGQEFAADQNPIYLIRTLPEKLFLPDGRQASGTWTGGWLGVLGNQMEDVTAFGTAWVSGDPPSGQN